MKGWTVFIHDLSGVAVAAACISTPFVSTSGPGNVSDKNPGSWLILRPDAGITYKEEKQLRAKFHEFGSVKCLIRLLTTIINSSCNANDSRVGLALYSYMTCKLC